MSDIVLKGDDGSTIVLNAPAETLIVLDGGLRGETGAAGATGPTGATGQGVPTGGTTNQYLKKNSATNYDTSWDSLDKTDVGLANVDNTADANKPVSTAQATAISTAQTNANSYTNTQIAAIDFPVDSVAGKTGAVTLTKADVGLPNVDNTSDANKPVSTATQTALDAKQATLVSGTNIKTINGTTLLGSGDLTITGGGGTAPDATTTTKGIVQLAGDLAGTADAPTVPGLATKEPTITAGTTAQYYRGDKTFQPLDKTAVGLGNVENAAASTLYVPLAGGTMTGQLNVNNTIALSNSAVNSGDGVISLITTKGLQIMNASATATFRLLPNSTDVYLQNTLSSGNILFSGLNGAQLTGNVIFNTVSIRPLSNLATNNGTSSFYWSSLFAQTLNLNATASISGATAGQLSVTGNLIGQSSIFQAARFTLTDSSQGVATTDTASLLRLSGGTINNGAVLLLGGSTNAAIPNFGAGRVAGAEVWNWTTTGITIGSTLSPATHSLTLQSNTTGIALYNTSDQTTNYERGLLSFTGNVLTLKTENGGTGTGRGLSVVAAGSFIISSNVASQVFTSDSSSSGGYFDFNRVSAFGGSNQSIVRIRGGGGSGNNQAILTLEATLGGSGQQYGARITSAVNMSGTGSYTALLINPTETTVGSGPKYLIDAQVSGVRKASIDNTGAIMVTGFDAALSTKTANYTLIVSDYTILFDATSGNLVATLPTAASSTGRVYNIKKIDSTANTVTIAAAGAELIDGANTKVISTQYNSYTIQSTGTGWVVN